MASQDFKTAIKGETRQTSAQVTFELLDTTASTDATISVTDKETDVSRESQVIDARDYSEMKFTTLENNYFSLDGKSHLTPKTTETISVQVGWLSDSISGSDGVFSTPPKVTFNFTSTHSSIGLTLQFDDEIPNSLTFVYYDSNNTELSRQTITNSKKLLVYSQSVSNYKKIEIYFNSTTNAYRRARLKSCVFGIIQQYTDDELIEFNLTRETSLISEDTIPISTCDFTIDNSSRSFNLINPSGVYNYLQEKQLIKTKIGVYKADGTIEYVNTGNYYLNDWKSDGVEATLTANDKLSFSTTLYNSSTSQTKTLKEWAIAILTALEFSDYEIDSSLDDTSVTTQFDDMDGKTLLKYIAQVSNTLLYVSENDKIVFKKIPTSKEDDIEFANMYKEPVITLDTKINQVDVKVWQYGVEPESQTTISTHNWSSGDEIFTKEIQGNPFITTSTLATSVGTNILSVLANRIVYELDWRQDPSIDINSIVEIEDGFNEDKNGLLLKNTYKYKGYLSGTSTAKGVTLSNE